MRTWHLHGDLNERRGKAGKLQGKGVPDAGNSKNKVSEARTNLLAT